MMAQGESHDPPQQSPSHPNPDRDTAGRPDRESAAGPPSYADAPPHPTSKKKKRKKKKKSRKRSVQAAAYRAAQEAAREKVRTGEPTTPIQLGILIALGLLIIGVGGVAVYLFTVEWPKQYEATALASDIRAQVAEFERLQIHIDMEQRVLAHTLQHGHPSERDDLSEAVEDDHDARNEQRLADAYDLPSIEESLRNLARLMRSAYRCIDNARRLSQQYLAMYGRDGMDYDSVHAHMKRLAEEEPAFLERAREVEALAEELGISLEAP